jgi:GNAT superfamily N-acetyltransferase
MSTIEPANPRDTEELVKLLGGLFDQENDFVPDPTKQRRALELLLNSPSVGVVLVYRTAGQIVAMVSLLFTISTAEGGEVCWLEDMFVRPEWRSRGVGSELLAAAVAEAERRNLLRITLLTDWSNVEARRLYARLGFTPSNMGPMRLHLPLARRRFCGA